MREIIVFLILAWPFAAALGEMHEIVPGQSIQEAVNCAIDGDTVLLNHGIYDETTVLYGKTLYIGSRFLLDGDSSHIAATTVLPNYARLDTTSCFVYAYHEREGSRLVGLTVSHGTGTYSALNHQTDGGGVYVCGSRLAIEHCRIEECSASEGGAILVAEDQVGDSASCCIKACTIQNCTATTGGALFAEFGEVEVRRTSFLADSVINNMAGGAITSFARSLIVDSCLFGGCIGGSGAMLVASGTVAITNCEFLDNGTSAGGQWTDFWIFGCSGIIMGCLFSGNASDNGSMFLSENGPDYRLNFVGNVVRSHHTANPGQRLLIGLYYIVNGEFAYNMFRDNTSEYGEVIESIGDVRRIHHNAFLNNVNQGGDGSALYIQRSQNDQLVVDSNVFVGNSSPVITSNFDLNGAPHPVHAEINWWGDPSGPYHPTLNPFGQGDTLLQDSIYFIPWLTAPPDTSLPSWYLSAREPPAMAGTWEMLAAYPNPFNAEVTIVLAGFAGSDFDISLFNLLGQQVDVVHRGALTGGQLVYQAPPWLASGVYLLSARDRQAVQTRKVILLK